MAHKCVILHPFKDLNRDSIELPPFFLFFGIKFLKLFELVFSGTCMDVSGAAYCVTKITIK